MNIHRRKFITKTATLAAGVSVFSLMAPGIASWSAKIVGLPEFAPTTQALAAPDFTELMKPGPLGEMSEGSDTAEVTIIEYASMTCPHCAAFHNQVYPQLKEKYIDTGKVRLIFREFPLDRVALAAIMIARCADKSQYFPLVDVLFKQQTVWARSKDPATELFKVAKVAGFTEDSFNACINNKDVAQGVLDVMNKGRDKFEVQSTPTFFINGKKVNGASTFEDFEKLLLEHIKS